MAHRLGLLTLCLAFGCDANVVEAVRGAAPAPLPTTSSMPPPPNPLETSLIHRYSFDGTGTEVRDLKGAAHGKVLATELPGTGQLPLEGERSGAYVDLPNYIISGLEDATFEVWVTWDGGSAWQRVFDFGNSTKGEDVPGYGTSYLFFTTTSSTDNLHKPAGTARLVYSQNGAEEEELCIAPEAFPIGVPTHLVAVINRSERRMAIYQDGALQTDCLLEQPLSAITDVNNWLGHSNYAADVDLAGTYDEFRIYGAALTAAQVSASFAAGPDAGR